MLRRTIPLFILLCASFSILNADICMTEKTSVISKGDSDDQARNETANYWFSEDKLRRDTPEMTIIIRLDKDAAYIIDKEKKSYREIPFSALSEAASNAPDLSNLPPTLRDMMKMKVTIEPTSETKKMGKWNCTKYNQTIEMGGGSTVSQLWATEDIKINRDLFRKFYTSSFLQQPAMKSIAGNLLEETEKIKGFVVKSNSTTKMMGTEVISTSEFTDVKESTAPAGTYDIPAGYKKTKWE